MKIAICVGHNSRSKGAFSKYLNQTEFDFNKRVAEILKQISCNEVQIFYRKWQNSYNKEISELANQVNKQHFDLALEMHFNSFNGIANGVEALYFHKSKIGLELATAFSQRISFIYDIQNRGAKPLNNESQNGFGFVQKMKAPALILEPFFGDNKEALKFQDPSKYACSIKEWLLKIQK